MYVNGSIPPQNSLNPLPASLVAQDASAYDSLSQAVATAQNVFRQYTPGAGGTWAYPSNGAPRPVFAVGSNGAAVPVTVTPFGLADSVTAGVAMEPGPVPEVVALNPINTPRLPCESKEAGIVGNVSDWGQGPREAVAAGVVGWIQSNLLLVGVVAGIAGLTLIEKRRGAR